jgi:hypothetical protein
MRGIPVKPPPPSAKRAPRTCGIMSRIGANTFEHPPRCLALDPLTLISARRTLRCRRNGLSRCFAV